MDFLPPSILIPNYRALFFDTLATNIYHQHKKIVMKPENILQSDVLDIVFENKNKAYGAYELRKHYNQRLYKALGAMGALVVAITVLVSWKTPNNKSWVELTTKDSVKLISLLPDEIKKTDEPKEKVQPKEKLADIPKQTPAEAPFTPPLIVEDPIIENPIAAISEIDTSAISNARKIGTAFGPGDIFTPPSDGKIGGEGEGKTPVVEEDPSPIDIAEFMPEFPGGKDALIKFMERNLSQPDDFETGQKMRVIAKFVVDKEGNIDDLSIETKGREDLDKEVLRVIKKMPKWKAGKQNGRAVAVYYKLPVTFVAPE
jgi:periplasmic protein TonB